MMVKMIEQCVQAMEYVISARKAQGVACVVVMEEWLQQEAFYPYTKTKILDQNQHNRIGANSGTTIRDATTNLTVT